MFGTKDRKIESFELGEGVLRVISDLAAIAADPKKLADTAKSVREQIALTDKEKKEREEYRILLKQFNQERSELESERAKLQEEIDEHVSRSKVTVDQIKEKELAVSESSSLLKKKQETHAKLEDEYKKRLDAIIIRESNADRKEFLLKEREANVSQRETEVKKEEQRIKAALGIK